MPADQPRTTAPPSTDQRFEKLFKQKLRRTRTLYQALLKRGQESFKKRMVPLPKIVEAAKIYHDQLKLSHTALNKLASMDEMWVRFKEHTSWYNSEIVEAVVMLHGDDNDKKNLEEFKKDRTNLVRYLGDNSDQGKKIQMILKLEEDFDQFSNERLEQVCLTLCDLLETTTCPLDVQEGCVKITMSIPVDVAEDVFPLSPAMVKAFQKAFPTLISISCGRIVETFEVSTALHFYSLCCSIFNGMSLCPQITEDSYVATSVGEPKFPDELCAKHSSTLHQDLSEDEYLADGNESDEEEVSIQ